MTRVPATRVLVCGSRDYRTPTRLFEVLDELHAQSPFSCIIEGEADGVDIYSLHWGRSRDVPVEKYPANWRKYGRAAGPIRNKQMLVEGKPDLVVAFPKGHLSESKGTQNMVDQATRAGIPVIVDGITSYVINEQEEPGSLA